MAGGDATRAAHFARRLFGFESRLAVRASRNPGAGGRTPWTIRSCRRGPRAAAVQPTTGRNGALRPNGDSKADFNIGNCVIAPDITLFAPRDKPGDVRVHRKS